jgi:signal transduction histidine kinase
MHPGEAALQAILAMISAGASSGAVVAIVLVCSAAAAAVAAVLTRSRARRSAAELDARVEQAQAALQKIETSHEEERAAQDLILSSMEEGVLLFDPGGHAVFSNAPLVRHLGASPADVDALLPLDLQDAARRSSSDGLASRLEVETGTPSRWLRATCTPIGGDGSLLIVISDVTEARRLDTIRRDFVANASHELKTPAASIQAAAETLLGAAESDMASVPRFATQLDQEARRLSRIVADLLDLSRLETGSELEPRVRFDLIVREEAQRFEEAADNSGVSLVVDAPVTPAIKGSPRDLALLVRNLLDNAINYTKAGGRVTATVTSDDQDVVLAVEDTGIGIPSRDLSRIFERFFRVDRARSRETGGTGLGLAIVRHVAENHGGSVSVQSELGRGSSFVVRLSRS